MIRKGLGFLTGVGCDSVCKVCISNGGSCCRTCDHLRDGEGCQKRNTGCTAWLCGFLKLLLYEAGLLSEWNDFWDQVPGRQFRQDETPSSFFVERWLNIPDLHMLGEALAKDIEEIIAKGEYRFHFSALNNEIDLCISTIERRFDEQLTIQTKKKLARLSNKFKHLNKEKMNLKKLNGKFII